MHDGGLCLSEESLFYWVIFEILGKTGDWQGGNGLGYAWEWFN